MKDHISVEDIIAYMKDTYGENVQQNNNWGERGMFYNPGSVLPKGVYILTFKEKDGANDKASQTDRDNVYRLNLGLSKQAFTSLFGAMPKRPAAGGIVDTGHDFTQLNHIMPHPVYGWMSWIGVLNPSHATFETLKPLIDTAVMSCEKKFKQRLKAIDKKQTLIE